MGRQGRHRNVSFLLTFVYKNVNIELTNINKHMNKYTKWYNNITENAKNRILSDYTESHHIQPRSLGGSDDVTNLVDLTPREHFICHWLLVKMTTGKDHHRMLNALRMMRAENQNQERYKTKITARVYESIKKEYSKLQSTQFRGKGNGFYGKTHLDEARRRISEANTGRKPPQHEIDKLKQSLLKRKEQGIKRAEYSEEYKLERSKMYTGEGNPRYGVEVSEETRKRIGDKLRGRKQTEEEKLVRSLANMGKKREKKLCPHCDQHVAVNGYARWHGENCKKKHQTVLF
jgi:hypothetical protein